MKAFNQIPTAHKIGFLVTILLVGTISFETWYGYNHLQKLSFKIEKLSADLSILEDDLSLTTAQLQETIAQTHTELSTAINSEKENVNSIASQLSSYREEVGTISGTVNNLEKLTQIDKELLQKYSKVFFLNEHYAPARLTEIPDNYEYFEEKHSKIMTEIWPNLKGMLDNALNDGIELYVYSAYRSFDEQNALKRQYKVIYGEGTANQFSADQGYSEHQLGTTVDLITTGVNGDLDKFDETEAYQWLLNNAYKYGFTLSYPENNSYYVYEPWHWRFVGIKLATDLHNQNKHFYDLDQREIDEYLIYLFE